MKQLLLTNMNFKAILSSYKEWLLLLGYAPSTVNQLPNYLQEFFFYLESKGVNQINTITQEHIEDYYHKLKYRANHKRSGGLSNSYLNKHQQALERFKVFINNQGHCPIYFNLKKEQISKRSSEDILTKEEVQTLFKVTAYSHRWAKLRSRDKVLLVLLYSLGLRRNEAHHVHCQDIDYHRGTLHVRAGKNYTERLIPINQKNLEVLKQYQDFYRSDLQSGNVYGQQYDHLLLNHTGTPLKGQSFCNRLKTLQELAKIRKPLTPHVLRHSIATHLLESGATIEQVSRFLGHRSLESTQLYTHLISLKDERYIQRLPKRQRTY